MQTLVGEPGYASLLIHNLTKRQEVRRLTRGWYTSSYDPIVSVFAFRPAYLGLQQALTLRGLWDQETNVVVVTPLRIRPGARQILQSTVVMHRIKPDHFFGFDYMRYGDLYVPVSDAEKTLIDLVYFNESPGNDVIKEVSEGLDRGKFHGYLGRYDMSFRRRVLGLLG